MKLAVAGVRSGLAPMAAMWVCVGGARGARRVGTGEVRGRRSGTQRMKGSRGFYGGRERQPGGDHSGRMSRAAPGAEPVPSGRGLDFPKKKTRPARAAVADEVLRADCGGGSGRTGLPAGSAVFQRVREGRRFGVCLPREPVADGVRPTPGLRRGWARPSGRGGAARTPFEDLTLFLFDTAREARRRPVGPVRFPLPLPRGF